MKTLVVFVILVAVIGCGHNAKPAKPSGEDVMPPNAYNIVDIGRGWYTFELKVGEKSRKFLFHREYLGISNANVECITELSP